MGLQDREYIRERPLQGTWDDKSGYRFEQPEPPAPTPPSERPDGGSRLWTTFIVLSALVSLGLIVAIVAVGA